MWAIEKMIPRHRIALPFLILFAAAHAAWPHYGVSSEAPMPVQVGTFSEMEKISVDKAVIFVSSGDFLSDTAVDKVQEKASEFPSMLFVVVDCAAAHSQSKCRAAGLQKGLPRYFISTSEGGVERLHRNATSKDLFDFLQIRRSPVDPRSSVVKISNQNEWESIFGQGVPVVANFFQGWCQHSKRFAKHWHKASVAASESGLAISFAQLDCSTKLSSICIKYGISSFPSVALLNPDGSIKRTFSGLRHAHALHEWLHLEMKGMDNVKLFTKRSGPRPERRRRAKETMVEERTCATKEDVRKMLGEMKEEILQAIYEQQRN